MAAKNEITNDLMVSKQLSPQGQITHERIFGDRWRKHNGEGCPVPAGMLVEIETYNAIKNIYAADAIDWSLVKFYRQHFALKD
jgi:hypothetical protein